MPQVSAITPTPISRSPQRVLIRRLDPRPIDPVVSIISIRPIPRRPDVSIPRSDRLLIYRNRRRRNSNRDEHTCIRRRRSKQHRTRHHRSQRRTLHSLNNLHMLVPVLPSFALPVQNVDRRVARMAKTLSLQSIASRRWKVVSDCIQHRPSIRHTSRIFVASRVRNGHNPFIHSPRQPQISSDADAPPSPPPNHSPFQVKSSRAER